MYAIKKKDSKDYITIAGYEGMMFLGINQSDPVSNFRNRKDAEQIHDLIDHPEQFDVVTDDNTYTLDRNYHKFGTSVEWEVVELGQASKMKPITTKEELELNRQYWTRSKDPNNKEIKMIYCVPWRGSVTMSFYVAEFMDGVKNVDYILENYDLIGPIPSMSKEEFQICFNKE